MGSSIATSAAVTASVDVLYSTGCDSEVDVCESAASADAVVFVVRSNEFDVGTVRSVG